MKFSFFGEGSPDEGPKQESTRADLPFASQLFNPARDSLFKTLNNSQPLAK